VIKIVLASLLGAKWLRMSESPRPEDWPSTTELAEAVAELESALELLPQAARLQAAIPLEEMVGLLHAQTGLLLAMLAQREPGSDQSAGERDAGLRARALKHMAMVPPTLLDQLPAVRDSLVLERVLDEDTSARGEKAEHIVLIK